MWEWGKKQKNSSRENGRKKHLCKEKPKEKINAEEGSHFGIKPV